MSMFDFVRITRPMPDGETLSGFYRDQLYQTKEMDCNGSFYEVTKNGQLEKASNGWTGRENYIHNTTWVACDYTGEMELQGNTANQHILTFVGGKLIAVRTVDWSKNG